MKRADVQIGLFGSTPPPAPRAVHVRAHARQAPDGTLEIVDAHDRHRRHAAPATRRPGRVPDVPAVPPGPHPANK